MNNQKIVKLAGLIVIAFSFLTPAGNSYASSACTFAHERSQLRDYRLRDSSNRYRGYLQDNNRYHYYPAIEEMRNGRYSENAVADITFILNWWPNHYPALAALIEYDLGGGQYYNFRPLDCFFRLARLFAPQDISVPLYHGYYYWKKGDLEKAREAYQEALVIDETSADAHYNLGLYYFEVGNYASANEHAQHAYSAGFPLPGLKSKLKGAGQWSER